MNKKNIIIRLIISSLFAIILAGLFFFVIRIIKNKNLHISKVLFTLNEKENQNTNALSLAQKLREVEDIQTTISNHLVDSKKPDTFVVYLEELGIKGGTQLDVKNLDISKKEKNTMNVGVSIEGSFTNVMKTISFLENAPYRIEITSINLDSAKQEVVDKKEFKTIWKAVVTFTVLIKE